MKKLIFPLFAIWSLSLNAQIGPQPLHISGITITPDGCDEDTSTITITAAGGQPAFDGLYTYQLNDDVVKTVRTATFTDVSDGAFLISDAAKNVTYLIFDGSSSSTKAISVDVTALPLGTGFGCVLVTVTNPPAESTVTIVGLMK